MFDRRGNSGRDGRGRKFSGNRNSLVLQKARGGVEGDYGPEGKR